MVAWNGEGPKPYVTVSSSRTVRKSFRSYLQKIRWYLVSSGWTRTCRNIFGMSSVKTNWKPLNRSRIAVRSFWIVGPILRTSLIETPVDVFADPSNTTRSLVVVLVGLSTQWCGR
uniref:(northern house mosquito) hypothetical protein n=1 Tax=Culex pipiens TaxID=7175 RepID=A0A8D8DH44_CULPI